MAHGRIKDISTNKKALRNYHIHDRFEAGVELRGTEVKSIRSGLANLSNAYARVENEEVFLYDLDIQQYEKASFSQHESKRRRRLLLNRREINKLIGYTAQKGYTLIGLRLYWKGHLVKAEIGVGSGKQSYDKRADLKKRVQNRETEREMARFNRR